MVSTETPAPLHHTAASWTHPPEGAAFTWPLCFYSLSWGGGNSSSLGFSNLLLGGKVRDVGGSFWAHTPEAEKANLHLHLNLHFSSRVGTSCSSSDHGALEYSLP